MAIGHIIAAIGLPALIELIGRVLGTLGHPAAKTASAALGTLKGTMNAGGITPQQIEEANRHTEELANMEYRAFETGLSEVNQTVRQEITSDDKYVRRMRPTFGYLMAVSWAAQMLGLAYIMVFETDKAMTVLSGMEALSAIWAMGLSVLGIYVYKRSEEKKILMPDIFLKPASQPAPAVKPAAPPPKPAPASPKPDPSPPVKRRRLNE